MTEKCAVCGMPANRLLSAPRGWGDAGPVTADECPRCAAADGWLWCYDGVVYAPDCEPVAYADWNPCEELVGRLADMLATVPA